jgi:hypothetical protein
MPPLSSSRFRALDALGLTIVNGQACPGCSARVDDESGSLGNVVRSRMLRIRFRWKLQRIPDYPDT